MPTIDPYDVIVAGGGPGGSTSAYYLGQAGMRVLVMEKETFPRYKACGGATSIKLLEQFPFSFDPVIESRLKEISYTCQGKTLNFPLADRPVCMVMRADFDAFLLSQARAEVCQGVAVQSVDEEPGRVKVRTRDGAVYQARYLIGADGPNSAVAQSLGLRRMKTLLGAIEVEAPIPQAVFQRFEETSLFIFGEIAMGYLWIFPKADHVSVGIGALHPRPGELQSTLRAVMERYGLSLQGLPAHGHPIPIYTGQEKISTARVLLVGDAAGLVDPLSGEGIQFAVESGRIAAEVILKGDPGQYEPRIQRQIGAHHHRARILADVFYRYPKAIFALGSRSPRITRALVGQISSY
jgi:geranylgeranyl reductase family protein